MRKSLALQAEMAAEFGACVFDVTLDCEDGAPVGGEADHAALVCELALAAAPAARVAVRVHAVDHPAFEADVATIARRAGSRLAYLMVPKPRHLADLIVAAHADAKRKLDEANGQLMREAAGPLAGMGYECRVYSGFNGWTAGECKNTWIS